VGIDNSIGGGNEMEYDGSLVLNVLNEEVEVDD